MKKLLALPLIAISLHAFAGFEVIENAKPAPTPAPIAEQEVKKAAPVRVAMKAATAPKKTQALVGGLTHTGRKPAIIPPAKGFGKAVSLKDAISMIVPDNFNVYNDTQIDLTRPTNWAATDGSDWVAVLDNALRNVGIAGTLDWQTNSISLEKQVAVAPVLAVQPEWLMTAKDKTVRNGIGRWAKLAGWNVDWDVAVDFPVPYDVTFKGDFETAVQQVMTSLAGSDYPVEACAYENKTVRIVRFGESQRCQFAR